MGALSAKRASQEKESVLLSWISKEPNSPFCGSFILGSLNLYMSNSAGSPVSWSLPPCWPVKPEAMDLLMAPWVSMNFFIHASMGLGCWVCNCCPEEMLIAVIIAALSSIPEAMRNSNTFFGKLGSEVPDPGTLVAGLGIGAAGGREELVPGWDKSTPTDPNPDGTLRFRNKPPFSLCFLAGGPWPPEGGVAKT